MRWQSYELQATNRTYRPDWTERRAVRVLALAGLWAAAFALALGVFA